MASRMLLLFLVQHAEMVSLPIKCRRRNTGSFLIASICASLLVSRRLPLLTLHLAFAFLI